VDNSSVFNIHGAIYRHVFWGLQ